MNTHDPEELLRDTLRVKALDATTGLTVDDVRRDAAAQKRRTLRRTAGGLAAAAAVLVGVPTALYLGSGDETPSPAPSPSLSPSVSPSSTPTSSPRGSRLGSVLRGKDPEVTYLHDGVVHLSGGGTTRLPDGATDVAEFTPYHGGWLVLDSVRGLTQYDNTGSVVLRSTTGEAALAISADQLRTAYQIGGHIRVGISTGMGDGETDLPVGSDARLVGFLGERVVYNAAGTVRAEDDAGNVSAVPGVSWADATSPAGDLVAGRGDGDSGITVVSATSGHVLWTRPEWVTGGFSPDGKYLAAYQSGSGGELDTVAILDARSGAVVTTSVFPGVQALPEPPTAWEDDDNLLIPYRGGSSWALLRLAPDGADGRASQVVESSPDAPPFVFAARP